MGINTITDSNALTFINLYTKDNPILEIGDECYFLHNNSIDFHIPIICRGIIKLDRFNDAINKTYMVSAREFIGEKSMLDKYIRGKQMKVYSFNPETLAISLRHKVVKEERINDDKFYDENLIMTDSFHIRNSLEKIQELQKEYIKIIRKDIEKQLIELNEFDLTL